ncbi:hypothetical protein SERLA73DRAFT_64153, partial [Serpula lacrymans var. lacrymans S7.3]
YSKYNKLLSTPLVKMLNLWDKIGLPHAEIKQIFNLKLPIISSNISPQAMTILLSPE